MESTAKNNSCVTLQFYPEDESAVYSRRGHHSGGSAVRSEERWRVRQKRYLHIAMHFLFCIFN